MPTMHQRVISRGLNYNILILKAILKPELLCPLYRVWLGGGVFLQWWFMKHQHAFDR